MPFLPTAQGVIFSARRGSGEPSLVCVHGAGGTHQHWGKQLRDLSNALHVVSFDLPGHGRSPGTGHSNVSDYSSVVAAVLDTLHLERVVLAGHSMGGAVALCTALAIPQRLAGLVLVGSGARLPVAPSLVQQVSRGDHAAAVMMIAAMVYHHTASPELRAQGEAAFLGTDPLVLAGDLQACAAYHIADALHHISCPTLIICGEEDRVTPPSFSAYLHEHIGGSSLVMVPNAGHMVLIEQPDAVTVAIRQFCASLTCQCRSG